MISRNDQNRMDLARKATDSTFTFSCTAERTGSHLFITMLISRPFTYSYCHTICLQMLIPIGIPSRVGTAWGGGAKLSRQRLKRRFLLPISNFNIFTLANLDFVKFRWLFRVEVSLFVLRPVGDLDFDSVFNLWAQHKKTHFYS
jgi:hypothetical protein